MEGKGVEPIKINKRATSIASTGIDAVANKWKMNLDDLAEEDIIDEMELVDDLVIEKPNCNPDSSTGGKKRACKNCTCGLAEAEMLEAKDSNAGAGISGIDESNLVKPIPKSACGSCYKGDAFRCASCPFLGKPAFDPDAMKQGAVKLSIGNDI